MIVVSRYTVGFINHPRTVNGSPERSRSAARDLTRSTPPDFIASPLHCVVSPFFGAAGHILRGSQSTSKRSLHPARLRAHDDAGLRGLTKAFQSACNARTDAADPGGASGTAIGKLLNLVRQGPVMTPETRACAMLHRSVQRPASRSSRASLISQSSRPAASSSAIWRSQAAASNSAYQARNAAISSGDNCWIAASISSTVLMDVSIPTKGCAANGNF